LLAARHPDIRGVSLAYLDQHSLLCANVNDFLEQQDIFDTEMASLVEEGMKYADSISDAVNVSSVYPVLWNAERILCGLLYASVILEKPQIVIETGIGNGFSTRVIQKALAETKGELHSFDIRTEVRDFGLEKHNSFIHILDKKNANKELSSIISSLKPIDIWFHDANHTYRWQKFEYQLALASLKPSGLLISDDIDASEAWLRFSKRNLLKSYCLIDTRKVIGIVRKP